MVLSKLAALTLNYVRCAGKSGILFTRAPKIKKVVPSAAREFIFSEQNLLPRILQISEARTPRRILAAQAGCKMQIRMFIQFPD